ncbi:alpha/beta fold hydrolase [Salinirubellus sp. GCM10025818]|uniref:alpha/beta fold hydrolase n=1 Tax=Salinirubellus TaxID=2162630 RepID=UPI0030D39D16
MRLRTALAGVGIGLGAAALANRALRREPGELEPPLGREPETYRWRGVDVAYTEAGDPDDPDLLLLHGMNAAASSHEFRHVVDALAEDYHVLAPDMPGFGHSDRPPLLYSGSLYVTFVTDFARDLTEDATVLASSLSGAYAARAAESVEFRSLVLVCPTASTIPGRRVWLRSLLRSPVVGEGLYNLLTSKPSIRYFLVDHGFAEEAHVTDEWVEYDWRTAHQPGARYAPASFVSGFLDLDFDLGAALADVDEPVTVVWGGKADLPPLDRGREIARAAGARLLVVEDADLLPHAEYPEEFLEAIREHLRPVGTATDG